MYMAGGPRLGTLWLREDAFSPLVRMQRGRAVSQCCGTQRDRVLKRTAGERWAKPWTGSPS